jgi:hypothetical protein
MLICNASLSDLLSFVKTHARIDSCDYFDARYARADEIQAWNQDKYRRNKQRRECFNRFPGRLRNANEALIPGSYGRLSIDAMGSIDYVVGQNASMEIWPALLTYLEATNKL